MQWLKSFSRDEPKHAAMQQQQQQQQQQDDANETPKAAANAEFSSVIGLMSEPQATEPDVESSVLKDAPPPALQAPETKQELDGNEDKGDAGEGKGADTPDAQLTPSSACTTSTPPIGPNLPGHVFVLLADITKLACDAWIGASGGVIDPRVVYSFPRNTQRVKKTIDGQPTKILGFGNWPEDLPRAYVACIDGSRRGNASFYVEVLEEYIQVALEDLKDKRPLFRRKAHLIAMPLIGSGHGGGRSRTGEIVRGLMPVLIEKALTYGMDFAIVTIEHNIWAAAQSERVKYMHGVEAIASANLRPELTLKAMELSHFALAGQLALFIGAGISVGAGLPLWDQLLEQLAKHADITDAEKEDFEKMTLYDQARVIQRRLEKNKQSLGRLVAEKLKGHRYSVAHSLFASLPVNEIITTNYDTLFEEAAILVQEEQPLSILPHYPVPGATRWLLKMHGCVTHPDDIVLTRRDYIRYAERGAALGGIVQSALLTKHLMFVGFSLSDDNFHRVFDAVLKAGPVGARHDKRNSALMLVRSQLQAELWDGEVGLTYIQEENTQSYDMADLARKHDIMLDLLSASCTVQGRADFLLNDRFEMMLTEPELELKRALRNLIDNLSPEAKGSPAWAVIEAALNKLGCNDNPYSYFKQMLSRRNPAIKLLGMPS